MFDEIFLMPHVLFNKPAGKFIGVNNGKICDHAMVFMVCGNKQYATHFLKD